jgi:ubiquinone/menaquinone biosynthesis C-methylase UbiE
MTDHYADYALFYDLGTTTDIAEKVRLIKQTVQKINPSAKDMLELACGTGNVLAQMQPEYTVTGLDLSPEMLDIARKNCQQ